MPDTFAPDVLHTMHAWWRASNYLSVGQIDLRDNPLIECDRSAMRRLFCQFSWPDALTACAGEVGWATACYIAEHGDGLPQVRDGQWQGRT